MSRPFKITSFIVTDQRRGVAIRSARISPKRLANDRDRRSQQFRPQTVADQEAAAREADPAIIAQQKTGIDPSPHGLSSQRYRAIPSLLLKGVGGDSVSSA
jgi:hypothetical protein